MSRSNDVPTVSLRRLTRVTLQLAQAVGGTLAAEAHDAVAEVVTVSRPVPPPRATYTVSEVVALTGRSESTIYRQLRAGTLPGSKLGGTWAIPTAAIADLANAGQHRSGPTTTADNDADVRDGRPDQQETAA